MWSQLIRKRFYQGEIHLRVRQIDKHIYTKGFCQNNREFVTETKCLGQRRTNKVVDSA